MILEVKSIKKLQEDTMTASGNKGEVVDAIVVATTRCTHQLQQPHKSNPKKILFAKKQFFPFSEQIQLQHLIQQPRLIPLTLPNLESRFDKSSQALDLANYQKNLVSQLVFIACKPYLCSIFLEGEGKR